MEPAMFLPGIRIVSDGKQEHAPPIRSYQDRKHKPEAIEMIRPVTLAPTRSADDAMSIHMPGPQTPAEAHTAPPSGQHTPTEPDMEASTPVQRNVVQILPSFSHPAINRWRVVCACLTYFAYGMNDGAIGPLIPYIEADYHVGYAVVSLIFISNAAGFITAAFCSDAIHSRLGRARTFMLAETLMIIGYTIIACTPPFGAVVAGYFFLGLGYAFALALLNVFCANLANGTMILGAGHGSYGVGGLVAPLATTSMVSHGILWSRFFIVLIAVRVIIFVFSGTVYRGYEQESTSSLTTSLEEVASRQRAQEPESQKGQVLRQVLRNRVTLLGALFIFAYQGAEVSISGWVISFLIKARNGDPAKVGYVTSGFFGGISLGRVTLTYFAPRVGLRLFVYLLIAGCAALQLLTWLVPSIVGDAVAVAVLGYIMGPIYPCCQTVFSQLLPRRLQVSCIGFIASAGSSGGALAPFLTGLLAQVSGPFVLNPICIGLYVAMVGCWTLLPTTPRRKD